MQDDVTNHLATLSKISGTVGLPSNSTVRKAAASHGSFVERNPFYTVQTSQIASMVCTSRSGWLVCVNTAGTTKSAQTRTYMH